jgi:hypothetical protein
VDIVRWLLLRGAKPTLNEGATVWTNLGDAAVQASSDIISMLVEGGAEIRGSCSLELAACTGRPEDNVVRLLELGADFNEVPHAET